MTNVKWFGKVTEGKDGSMYFGETPARMKAESVGVSSRWRKSARKPSREISRVVGAKREVPLLIVFGELVAELERRVPVALYAP